MSELIQTRGVDSKPITGFVLAAFCGLFSLVTASTASAQYFEGFEVSAASWPSATTRVASGTNGITSAAGSFHGQGTSGAFTRWGVYNSTFPANGYTTAVDIYLNMSIGAANDTRFDFTSAINNTSSPVTAHRRDFAFNGGFYNDAGAPGSGNRFVFSASNSTGRANAFPKNPGRDPIAVTTTGWYTFKHTFRNNAGVLAVDLQIINSSNVVLHTWTLSDPTDIIGVTVGGNRYGWFPSLEFNFLAIDNARRDDIPDQVLPVELSGFDVTTNNDKVYLNWHTASEIANAGFEVQRAGSDALFVPVASYLTTPSLTGLGTSSQGKSYNYTDGMLVPGRTYLYRLVDVATDGMRTIHPAKSIRIEASDAMPGELIALRLSAIVPNPVLDQLHVSFVLPEAGTVMIELFSTDGRNVGTSIEGKEYPSGMHTRTIKTDDLVAGSYTLRLSVGGSSRVQRFVVVR